MTSQSPYKIAGAVATGRATSSSVERKSRVLLLSEVDRKGSTETYGIIIQPLGKLPTMGRSAVTQDNGTENAMHENVTLKLGLKYYFARPYAEWLRGANIHANGLVWHCLPKGTDFSQIDKD